MCGDSSQTLYELEVAPHNGAIDVVLNCCPNCTMFNIDQFPESSGVVSPGRRLLQREEDPKKHQVVGGFYGAYPEPTHYVDHGTARHSMSRRHEQPAEEPPMALEVPTEEGAGASRVLLGRHPHPSPPPPPPQGCTPWKADTAWPATVDASITYELSQSMNWRQFKGMNDMDLRMYEDSLNITQQYLVAFNRLAALTATDTAGEFTFGTKTINGRQSCTPQGALDAVDPCEVSATTLAGIKVKVPASATKQPLHDDTDIDELAAQHEAEITKIFTQANTPRTVQGSSKAVSEDQHQLACPPKAITGSFPAGPPHRPGLGAITCSGTACIQATACKDGTCRCDGTVSLKSEMRTCQAGSQCLTDSQREQIRQHATTISTQTKNMTQQGSGGVVYMDSKEVISISEYTVRFNDGPGAPLQCAYVNATACVTAPCHPGYFDIEHGTEVLGSLKTAIAGGDLHFQLNVTVLGNNYQAALNGKLTAFNTDSNLVRDLIGSAALYLQKNKTCT